jgi:hypothetical protein
MGISAIPIRYIVSDMLKIDSTHPQAFCYQSKLSLPPRRVLSALDSRTIQRKPPSNECILKTRDIAVSSANNRPDLPFSWGSTDDANAFASYSTAWLPKMTFWSIPCSGAKRVQSKRLRYRQSGGIGTPESASMMAPMRSLPPQVHKATISISTIYILEAILVSLLIFSSIYSLVAPTTWQNRCTAVPTRY